MRVQRSRNNCAQGGLGTRLVKYHISSITPVLQDFADVFSISLVFDMFFTLVLVEVKLNGI